LLVAFCCGGCSIKEGENSDKHLGHWRATDIEDVKGTEWVQSGAATRDVAIDTCLVLQPYKLTNYLTNQPTNRLTD